MSIFYDIIDNIATDVTTVLTPFSVPVSIRRRNVYQPTIDPLPVCIVAPGDSEELRDMDFDEGTSWLYPVIVNLIYPDDRHNDLQADAQEYLDIRQAIRDQIFYPLLSNVPQVWDVEIDGTKPFTLVDQKSTYSSTQWIVKYKAKEDRRSI